MLRKTSFTKIHPAPELAVKQLFEPCRRPASQSCDRNTCPGVSLLHDVYDNLITRYSDFLTTWTIQTEELVEPDGLEPTTSSLQS